MSKAPGFPGRKNAVVMSQWATECGARQRNSQITVMIRPGGPVRPRYGNIEISKYRKEREKGIKIDRIHPGPISDRSQSRSTKVGPQGGGKTPEVQVWSLGNNI